MRRSLLVLTLGLALVMTGCLSRRPDERVEIDQALDKVMQAIVKADTDYLVEVLVDDLDSSVTWKKDSSTVQYDINRAFLHGFYQFDVWRYMGAQLTARTVQVTGGKATATGAYRDVVHGVRIRTSTLKVELQWIGGQWKVTKLEFLDLEELY